MIQEKSKNRLMEWVLPVLCLSAIVLSIIALSKPSKTINIGYVKTGELMNNFQGFKDAQEMLQGKHQLWKANSDTLETQFTTAIAQYNARIATLSKEEKQRQEELLAKQEQQKNNYVQGVQQRAQQEQQIAMDSIVTYVNSFVKEFAKSNGYDFIFGTTNDGSLLYGNEATDITAIITQEMNTEYSKSSLFGNYKAK